jgi:ATP-dependent Lon protease
MIDMRTASRRVTNNYKHKRCKMRTTKIKITTIKKVTSSYNQEGGKRNMIINMRIVIKKVARSCKHKRYKTQTTKITIMTTKRVVNSYSQEGGKGR